MEMLKSIAHRLHTLKSGKLQRVVMQVDENFGDQDYTDVMNKLGNFGRAASADARSSATFALEDDKDNIIKVVVPQEEAEDFEKALQQFVNDMDGRASGKDIAEILYSLRMQFDILDVNWPRYFEDEETDQLAQSSDEVDGVTGDKEFADDEDDGVEGDSEPEMDDNSVAPMLSLMQQIIDMMSADAAARGKEAEAKEAEAEATLQTLSNQQLINKVRQEEQIIDMETDVRAKKEQEKEVKRLAQLAHWKSDISQGRGLDPETATNMANDEIFDGETIGSGVPQQRVEDEQQTLFKGIVKRPLPQSYAPMSGDRIGNVTVPVKKVKNVQPKLTRNQAARILLGRK